MSIFLNYQIGTLTLKNALELAYEQKNISALTPRNIEMPNGILLQYNNHHARLVIDGRMSEQEYIDRFKI